MKRLKLLNIFSVLVLSLFVHVNAYGALNVTGDDVTAALRDAFLNSGVEDAMDIEFFGGTTSFVLPRESSFKIMVSDLDYSEGGDKFSCHIDVFAEGQLVGSSDLIGKYYLLDRVYVPTRTINKGEIISAEDIKPIMFRRSRIKSVNITDKDKIIGKEAKRILKTGKLIMNSEIGDKVLIHKGDVVSAVYQTKQMQITTRAEALEDGSKGERIELQNPKSKKSIYGVVQDKDTVQVEIQ